jgi:vacuolar-type H+-ATPase subunit H
MEIKRIAELAERVHELLGDAERQAKDIVAKAESKADEIIAEAKKQAKDIITRAQLKDGIEKILEEEAKKAREETKNICKIYQNKKESIEKNSEKQFENAVEIILKEVLLF